MRDLGIEDIEAIAIGAAILGTGGGGNPTIGKLRCIEELKKGRRIRLMPGDLELISGQNVDTEEALTLQDRPGRGVPVDADDQGWRVDR